MKITLMPTLTWPLGWEFKKAKTWSPDKYLKHLPLGVEVKFNGLRLLGVKDPRERVGVFPRKISVKTGGYINKWKRLPAKYRKLITEMPKGTAIEFELHKVGVPSQVMVGRWNAGVVEEHKHSVNVFGIPYYKGVRVDACMEGHRLLISKLGFKGSPRVAILKTPRQLESLMDLAKRWKIEGWMLKDEKSEEYMYHHFKLVPIKTFDGIVMGFQPGKKGGKHENGIGSIVVGLFTKENTVIEVCTVGGMTDAVRAKLSKTDIGKVVEVEYKEVK